MKRREQASRVEITTKMNAAWPPTREDIIRKLRKWASALYLESCDDNWTFDGKIGSFNGKKPNGDIYVEYWSWIDNKWLSNIKIVLGIEIEAARGGHISPYLNTSAKAYKEMQDAISAFDVRKK